MKADIAVGNDSTGWCNLANIAFRAAKPFSRADADRVNVDVWDGLVDEMQQHLSDHGISMESSEIRLSPTLELDPKTEQFVGDHADAANKFLKREYRQGYEVPELA